jgi:hypothetical protein
VPSLTVASKASALDIKLSPWCFKAPVRHCPEDALGIKGNVV